MFINQKRMENLVLQYAARTISNENRRQLEKMFYDPEAMDQINRFIETVLTDDVLDLIILWSEERSADADQLLNDAMGIKKGNRYLKYIHKSLNARKRRKKKYRKPPKRLTIGELLQSI